MRVCFSVTAQLYFKVREIYGMVTGAEAFGSTVLLNNLYNGDTILIYYTYMVGGSIFRELSQSDT